MAQFNLSLTEVFSLHNKMKKELIEALVSVGAVKYGTFILASGKESNYYVDIKKAITDPKLLMLITRKIIHITSSPNRADAVAGIEIGGVPLATAVSLEFDIPMVIVRKQVKEYGVKELFIGEVDGKKILLVEDVTTTGGSAIEGIKKIRDGGGMVDTVVTIVDRNEGARKNLNDIDVNLISLVDDYDLKEK